jgi:hypothetical protein
MNRKWVTTGGAARYYNTTTQTIRTWCKDGTLLSVGCIVMRGPKGTWRIILPHTAKNMQQTQSTYLTPTV